MKKIISEDDAKFVIERFSGFDNGFVEVGIHNLVRKPRTTGLRLWLCPVEYYPRLTWAVSVERLLHRVAGSPAHSPREIAARGVHKALTEKIISQGESPRLPRSDKQEEAKCIFGPSVSTPTSYPSCSIRIGAYARAVLWYGVNHGDVIFSIAFTVLGGASRNRYCV